MTSSEFYFSLSLSLPPPSIPPQIAKLDKTKRSVVHVYLFTDKNFHDPTRSLNRQMAASDLFKHQGDVFLSSHR
jgi:hypothetical protein